MFGYFGVTIKSGSGLDGDFEIAGKVSEIRRFLMDSFGLIPFSKYSFVDYF
jgi:hypothetical protein